MAGRYFIQCPACRGHRRPGMECPGAPVPARARRKVEKRQVRREVGEAMAERVDMECEIVARCLFGSSALEFYKRLPVICNWLEGIPEGHLRKLASDCSWATDEEALGALLNARRPGFRGRAATFTETSQRAERMAGGGTVRMFLDFVADAGYIAFDISRPAHRTVELTDRVNLDYDTEGNVTGIEVLGIS